MKSAEKPRPEGPAITLVDVSALCFLVCMCVCLPVHMCVYVCAKTGGVGRVRKAEMDVGSFGNN